MIENRCHNCKHLMFKSDGGAQVEIICPKCRNVNYLEKGSHTSEGPRGASFQEQAFELRDPASSKLLCRVIGGIVIEMKHPKIAEMLYFDTNEIKRMRNKFLPDRKKVA